jgi:hypothetical protein
MAFIVEFEMIIGGNTAGFLAPVLQRVKAEGDEKRGFGVTENANDATFLARLVVI